jgi:4-diphosphocytidyl-2-C-methyl-D-erythritol kinase
VILFPNCKINLGLHILRKREDGFHDLETVFYPIPLTDALEVIHEKDNQRQTNFSSSGIPINGKEEDNICIKAYQLLKKDFDLPPVKIHLHKNIPVGAGLGGGSSDGAFMLLLLNKKFALNIPEEKLIDYALQLGSDCPFFIKNKVCHATQRGEKLTPLELDLSQYKIVLINPGIHINTGWAFSQIRPSENRTSILEIIQQPVENWKGQLSNDFEEAVFEHHPAIKEIKQELYSKGAVYASMTGSGSTVLGLLPKENTSAFNFRENYFIHQSS